jgi:hypothetical protein
MNGDYDLFINDSKCENHMLAKTVRLRFSMNILFRIMLNWSIIDGKASGELRNLSDAKLFACVFEKLITVTLFYSPVVWRKRWV